MKYATVCSGIEAPSAAWPNWDPVFFSEIEPYPSAVLNYHYPNVPNLGDMTKIKGKDYHGAVDLILGGTPCQGFSNAGKRGGLDDERSGLARHFTRLVSEIQPRWVVWENVPGCFSCWSDEEIREQDSDICSCSVSGNGAGYCVEDVIQSNDFEAFTSSLVECGYNLAYRVLNAQYFGVPQRRRRIFVVGYLGDWRPASAVLFERPNVSGNPKQIRKAEKEASRSVEVGSGECSGKASPLTTRPYSDRGAGDESKLVTSIQSISTNTNQHGLGISEGDVMYTLNTVDHHAVCVDSRQDPDTLKNCSLPLNANLPVHSVMTFQPRVAGNGRGDLSKIVPALTAESGKTGKGDSANCVFHGMTVRRLTPKECERLQGLPDGYTDIPFGKKPKYDAACADSHRYKALGNTIARPCLEWIGKRIEMVDKILNNR